MYFALVGHFTSFDKGITGCLLLVHKIVLAEEYTDEWLHTSIIHSI